MKKQARVKIGDDWYSAQVFLVNTRHEGILRNVTHIPEDHEVHLAGGEEFVIMFMRESELRQ